MYLGHNSEPEVPSPYYNCGSCGDRILSNDQHECWVYHKMQDQEHYKDQSAPYADFSGSEDVVARLKKPPQYEVYS